MPGFLPGALALKSLSNGSKGLKFVAQTVSPSAATAALAGGAPRPARAAVKHAEPSRTAQSRNVREREVRLMSNSSLRPAW
ncbi:MAG: hypothetical protein M3416_03140 [Acidobacteriota bacterium]|nr:hypothetical protein [Acidobacteriota bacterium]